ncbi:hypothetical protein VTN77DRAFT_3041 [Rasamsonia byssochlamydoides]|uniref:uncharacterized protein n=1 Tax=Rasamsonia byssochlamydoides TaxID=89139 RepID=UPI0037434DB9
MRLLSGIPSLGAAPMLLRSYTARIFLVFLLLYLLLVQYARTRCYRDPTSVFFDAERGYRPAYSAVRTEQANSFIEQVNSGQITPYKASDNPSLCVGVATIARNGARYFKTAVGSLLENLSESERAELHLILFIAHSDPHQHPAYEEKWLHEVADTVLLYNWDEVDKARIVELEQDHNKISGREKGLFDYTYLLKACYAVNASHVVMLEDDVVALDGWLHRAQRALDTAARQTAERGASNYLYLRMFYTEEFLGWNSEEWPAYLFYSVLAVAAVGASLLGTRHYFPSTKRFIPDETILLLCTVCTPLLIILFFAAGRVTMLPIPAGVNEMPKFGCCSQGFIFPQSRVPDLIQWYESKHIGYVDMLTEEYADQNREIRWAITPTLLQHVGSKSSKGDDFTTRPKYHRSMSERLWSFAFETNDADALRAEHDEQRQLEVR